MNTRNPRPSLLACMYDARNDDKQIFGAHWCGPEYFRPGEITKVADYQPQSNDGRAVSVMCTAMPARFYQVVVPDKDTRPGYEFGTGSSMAQLAHDMAKAISEGMLDLEK